MKTLIKILCLCLFWFSCESPTEPEPEGCDGVPGSGLEFDDCGICDGNNESMDDCGVCDGNNENIDEYGCCEHEVYLWDRCYDVNTTTELTCNGQGSYDVTDCSDMIEIPSKIEELIYLTKIDIGSGNTYGQIPPQLGNLTNLTHLDLYGNFTGGIPKEIGNLSNLKYLSLNNIRTLGCYEYDFELCPTSGNDWEECCLIHCNDTNECEGNIPVEIGNLINLEHFYMSGSKLRGELPSEIGNLINLQTLWLTSGDWIGDIPSEIGNLTNLKQLWLWGNEFTSIPSEIGNLVNLEDLDIHSNQLEQQIPIEIGNMNSLSSLDLRSNQLTGEIPVEILNLTNLSGLYLRSNQLTGEIPEEICNVYVVDIRYNNLCPPYPLCDGITITSEPYQDTSNCP